MMDVVTEGDLIARREGAAGIIRLNRPKAINAVTLEMFRDIDKALDAFEADPQVAVIVLEGAGERGLCAGGDIRALYESSQVKGDLGKILSAVLEGQYLVLIFVVPMGCTFISVDNRKQSVLSSIRIKVG